MVYLPIYLVVAIILGIGGWQLVVWLGEVGDKRRKFWAASAYALKRNKPMLVAGGPWGNKSARRWFNMPAHGNGDVCLDINHRPIQGHPCGVIATVTAIPFRHKSFGAVFASHLLEHLPTVADAEKALAELDRVAEAVYIAFPSRQSIAGWLTPGHHLQVWQKNGTTFLKQRGRPGAESGRSITIGPAGE
jgi:hypothetical protein